MSFNRLERSRMSSTADYNLDESNSTHPDNFILKILRIEGRYSNIGFCFGE